MKDLEDSPFVCHRHGKVGREIELDGVVRCPCLDMRLPRPVQQARHVRGLGASRQHSGLDLCQVDQFVDQIPHPVGLLVDHHQELPGFGGVGLVV